MKSGLSVFFSPVSATANGRAATAARVDKSSAGRAGLKRGRFVSQAAGFTLTEVVVALAIMTLTFTGVIYGYIRTADRAVWSSYSLAAQSLAMQGVEQARAAKWDPRAWPVVDDLPVTNLPPQGEPLDVPVAGEQVWATNYISVTMVSPDPPLRQLRADCVWSLNYRPAGISGPFTNTAVTLRAPDQ